MVLWGYNVFCGGYGIVGVYGIGGCMVLGGVWYCGGYMVLWGYNVLWGVYGIVEPLHTGVMLGVTLCVPS